MAVYTNVIIVGGGFAGLNCVKQLAKANVKVLILDKTNHHVFQPLLYQVATASLSPGNIAVPIREIVSNQPNVSVIMADVVSINKEKRTVTTSAGDVFSFDYLVLAPGARHSYFGKDQWEVLAPGLKTVADALRIRETVLLAFEHAESCDSLQEAAKFLRFVIIGGGPTGVELAGSIAEIAHKTMFSNFRRIKPEQTEIYLIEGQAQVLPAYPPKLADIARKDLEKLGVKVMCNSRVTDINPEGVYLGEQFIETPNVIWAAGNQASPLLKELGTPLDRQGRVIVEPDLSVPGYPEIFVIGDAAHNVDKSGNPLPGIAPVAIQQGKYLGKLIRDQVPPADRKPFKYFDKGTMATIGKAKAVAMMGKLQFSGFIAWLAWCFIHILYLISFRNRVLVALQWTFWYLSGRRQVRIITRPIYECPITPAQDIKDSQGPRAFFASVRGFDKEKEVRVSTIAIDQLRSSAAKEAPIEESK